MCGPKSTERKLDVRHFGFPFDRKIDFDLFDEEWVFYEKWMHTKVFFVISFVATKEIKILFKPDEDASNDDLRLYVENLNKPGIIKE